MFGELIYSFIVLCTNDISKNSGRKLMGFVNFSNQILAQRGYIGKYIFQANSVLLHLGLKLIAHGELLLALVCVSFGLVSPVNLSIKVKRFKLGAHPI